MSTCSVLVILRRHSEYAVAGLLSVVVIQALGYGLIFDLNFFLRNLSVMGGLLMVLGDSFVKKTRMFAGLPSIDEKDKKMYIQLGGRVLLIFLFIGFVFAGDWSFGRVLVSLIGFVACVMVVVGFKAKLSAIILVLLLSIFNILVNNFWTVSTLPGSRTLLTFTATFSPPTQGFRQIRLLPDFVNHGWTAITGEHGTRTTEHGREEESLLESWKEAKTGGLRCSIAKGVSIAWCFTEDQKQSHQRVVCPCDVRNELMRIAMSKGGLSTQPSCPVWVPKKYSLERRVLFVYFLTPS